MKKKVPKKIVYVRVKPVNHTFLVNSAKQNEMTRSKWLDSVLDVIRIRMGGTKGGNIIQKAI